MYIIPKGIQRQVLLDQREPHADSCSAGFHAGIAFVTIIAWIPGHAATYLGQHSQIPGQAQDLLLMHLECP